ncbi:MAG: hypothetical protein ABII68_03655 [Pseudomonadota bacterium]
MKITRPPASLGEAPPESAIIELDCGHERALREGEIWFCLETPTDRKYVCSGCLGENTGFMAHWDGPLTVTMERGEDER